MSKHSEIFDRSVAILKLNDKGAYTVPTHGLYPFQWNWDSCLTALGFSHFDEQRAWREIETLFEHQWEDGMVPHIVFHEVDDGYFPGPDVWSTGRSVPTSGITQPPVAGFAVKRLFDRSENREQNKERVRALVKAIDQWHQWFFDCRDPQSEGLVALIHPWESGRDNSVDWDKPFASVPIDGIKPYTRRDTQHADPEHRPTKEQYDRYIWLVEHFRSLEWDNSILHDNSPFRVVDPGFNAILLRSCFELAALANELGESGIAQRNSIWAKRGVMALEKLWSSEHGQYVCWDRVTEEQINSASIGGILTVFAPLELESVRAIVSRLESIARNSNYLVASHEVTDKHFDGKRYWRGPVWLIVNYMIIDGLKQAGQHQMAARIERDSQALIAESGFAEYYDPLTAEGCGGDAFTWTAAMMLEFISS